MTCHWRPGFMPWRREGRTEVTTREPGDLPRHITSSGGVSGQVAGPARPPPSSGRAAAPARAWSPRQNQHRRGPCPSPLHRPASAPRVEDRLGALLVGQSDRVRCCPLPQRCGQKPGRGRRVSASTTCRATIFPYDHVLDTSAMVGAIPALYGWTVGMARPGHLLRHGTRLPGRGAPDAATAAPTRRRMCLPPR